MNNNCSDFQQIQPCSSMNYFVEKIENSFFANTAFIDGKTIIRYSEFCENIRKCVSYFRRFERRYYNINTLSAYYFSMAYLAVVCSGNVAVLSKQPILTDPSGKIPVYKVTEKILRDAISNECPSDIFISTDTEAIATVAQSSGTTSVAKGVALSQKALLCNMHAGMTAIKFDESFRYLHVIPYYHLFGLVSNMLAPLYVGATICDSGKPLSVYSDFLKYNISATCLPPVLVTGLWNMIERYGFENITGGYLKKIICAGAPPDFSVYDGFEKIGVHIFTGYGLTECAPCVSVNGDYANLWRQITGTATGAASANNVNVVTGEAIESIAQYSPSECSEVYGNDGQAKQYGFVINTNLLGPEPKNAIISAKNNDNKELFQEATTYPRLVYVDEGNLASESFNPSLSSAEGIYIIAVRDPGSTTIAGTNKSAYYDFYIRTCWYGTGDKTPSTISTVMRLYDPGVVNN